MKFLPWHILKIILHGLEEPSFIQQTDSFSVLCTDAPLAGKLTRPSYYTQEL